MGEAVALISVQIYEYILTNAHKLRKFLSVTPICVKKWVKSLFLRVFHDFLKTIGNFDRKK